ncbi:MAG: zf-TFIIB domain-containing protein [Dehalococcoidia bacterium]|nr:MAG: zf-TFIIB domain-containing protein [Dehalococcoidia bacterium]
MTDLAVKEVTCPRCKASLKIPDLLGVETIVCHQCGLRFHINVVNAKLRPVKRMRRRDARVLRVREVDCFGIGIGVLVVLLSFWPENYGIKNFAIQPLLGALALWVFAGFIIAPVKLYAKYRVLPILGGLVGLLLLAGAIAMLVVAVLIGMEHGMNAVKSNGAIALMASLPALLVSSTLFTKVYYGFKAWPIRPPKVHRFTG